MKRDLKSMGRQKDISDSEEIKEATERYSSMSEGELYDELLKTAGIAKENGMDESSFDEFEKKVSPMLNEQQRKRLHELIGKIR